MILPKQIHYKMEILPEQAWVYGNQTQLQEVIWNLCSNARDAMKETGGVLRVTVKQIGRKEIVEDIEVSQYDDIFLRITVSDDGCGMEPAVLEHLFDSFFTTKPVGEERDLVLAFPMISSASMAETSGLRPRLGRGVTSSSSCRVKNESRKWNTTAQHRQSCCSQTGRIWRR